MYWHQSHQLSPCKSIAPRQVAFTHDFAEILRRLFLLWRHNFVTWPDLTKFFSPKVPQKMPHKLWKISARSSKRCGVQLRKTHGGGCINPPLTGRGLTRALLGLWISHRLLGGGGGVWTPPPMISAPGRRREKRKAAFESSRKIISKSFRSFFGSGQNWGLQGSKFQNFPKRFFDNKIFNFKDRATNLIPSCLSR